MAVTKTVIGQLNNAEQHDSKVVQRTEKDVGLVHGSLVCGQN